MPQFNSLEEKALYELDKLENENAELKQKIDDQQVTIREHEHKEELYKELMMLFNVRYRDCITVDEPMIDGNAIYPHDKEAYTRAKDILKELGIVLRTE